MHEERGGYSPRTGKGMEKGIKRRCGDGFGRSTNTWLYKKHFKVIITQLFQTLP